jgi:hypothetical protein
MSKEIHVAFANINLKEEFDKLKDGKFEDHRIRGPLQPKGMEFGQLGFWDTKVGAVSIT